VLKAGLPPVRGRKIRFYRDRALAPRVRPPPPIPPCAPATAEAPPFEASPAPDPLTLEAIAPALAAAGLDPLPPQGASPEAVEAWVDRFLEQSATVCVELKDHGR
jgi:type IV secretion system protein VirD4